MPSVHIPRQLQKFSNGQCEFHSKGKTLLDIYQDLIALHPGLCGPVFTSDGKLQRFIGVFVDGHSVAVESPSEVNLTSDAHILFINAVAGG